MASYRAIIDSGATYTQLPSNVGQYDFFFCNTFTQCQKPTRSTNRDFISEIESFCKGGADRCKGHKLPTSEYCYAMSDSVKNTKEFFLSFPEVSIQIGTESINWSPSEYFVVDLNDPTKYCLGVEHQVYARGFFGKRHIK